MNKLLILLMLCLLPMVSATQTWNLHFSDGTTTINATDICVADGTCLTDSGSGDISAVNTNGPYLSGGATTGAVSLLFDSSALNITIDARSVGNLSWNETWADTLYADISVTDTDTTYTAGDGIILTGTQFNHSDTSSQASSDNSARTYIQDIILDAYGHITSIVTATETVTNTDTQDLSYNASTDIISLTDGGSIDITEVDTNTNANTICSGTTTYLDGEGNCDDISGVYADISVTGDNSSWSEVRADTLYRTITWDNFTGIPTATPSNGDTTHLSTADQIYDWVISLSYTTTSFVSTNFLNLSGDTMSGDLNMNINDVINIGNLTLSGFTNGSVLYISEDGKVSQMNEAFYFEPNGAEGKLAVGDNAIMRNIFQAVKDEGTTDMNNVKALIAVRNKNIVNGTYTGFSFQTLDTDGEVYSGIRLMSNFTSHVNDSISADFLLETNNEGTKAIKLKVSSDGNLYVSDLISCNTIDTDANGMLICGTDSTDNSSWSEVRADTLYRTITWDNFTGIPTATPTNGDTTHLSTADQIYDWVISLAYATSSYVESLGNWSAVSSQYWNTSTDIDTVIDTDEITELKIDFNTACAAGNHLYVNGNNLACEADDDTTDYTNVALTNITETFVSNVTVEELVFENNVVHSLRDNSTCIIIKGSTSVFEVC